MPRRVGRGALIDQISSSGGGAEALLNEAAVRFDFSQYTDINDMVDVNGGWGPIHPDNDLLSNDTVEFTAEGLHLADANPVKTGWDLNAIPGGGGVMGAAGNTILHVVQAVARTNNDASLMYLDIYADGNGDAINISGRWQRPGTSDEYTVLFTDRGPGFATIVSEPDQPSGFDGANEDGVFVWIEVVDIAVEEVRLIMASSSNRFDDAFAFAATPAYIDTETTIDTIFQGGSSYPRDVTLVEDVIWNRALTEAEVDALVAHFTA